MTTTFHTGSIQTFTNAENVMDVLRPLIVAHPAWSYVHRDANGYDIFSCDGAFNDWGTGFYVALGSTTDTTFLRAYVFEQYDNVTEAIRRPCIRGAGPHTVTADGSIGDTWWLYGETYGIDSATQAAARPQVTINTTVTQYWLSISNNRLALFTLTGTTTTTSMYLGLFESFIPAHAQEFPLAAIRLDQTSTSLTSYLVGGWSRHPGRDAFAADRDNFAVYPFSTSALVTWSTTQGTAAGTTDDLFHTAPVGSRALIRPLANTSTYGHLRGLLYGVIRMPITSGVTVGDTISVNGTLYYYAGINNNWIDSGELG